MYYMGWWLPCSPECWSHSMRSCGHYQCLSVWARWEAEQRGGLRLYSRACRMQRYHFSETWIGTGLLLYSYPESLHLSLLTPQAVDVVGQAGKPKTITGFQTHTTPVLLAHGERAELATEEFLPVTPILEGFVILRKNPNYDRSN